VSLASVPRLPLNTGAGIPALGFGVFAIDDAATASVVAQAIESGYRSIDTAAVYLNETGVGHGIAASGVAREELFITTKLWNSHHLTAPEEFQNSLDRLGLDYVDLYLIHWPVSAERNYLSAWDSLETLRESGRARAIGVSNFSISQLEEIIAVGGTVPAVNQIELHPLNSQPDLRAFHAENGILTESWSPLGRGLAFGLPAIAAIATAHGVTEAQVVLRWHLQLGLVPLPKSESLTRIRENADIFGFELAPFEMARIDALSTGTRVEDSYYEWA
jgi:2,5-diketo-D-gluconate reductase A